MQENKTVSEYEREFTRLSKYIPALVADDGTKALRFTEGLIPPLRRVIRGQLICEFRRAIDVAIAMEEDFKQNSGGRDNKRKETRRGPQTNHPIKKGNAVASNAGRTQAQYVPKCMQCGDTGHATAVCKYPNLVCFICKKPSHRIMECTAPKPQLNPSTSWPNQRTVQVHHLDHTKILD